MASALFAMVREVYLTSIEFKLLVYLAQHRDQLQDRQTLIEQVWGYEYYIGDPRTVDVHIRNLRQKIEADPHNPQIIVTVRGAGYKLVASIKAIAKQSSPLDPSILTVTNP